MSNKSSSKPTSSQPVGKSTRYEEIRNGSGYMEAEEFYFKFKFFKRHFHCTTSLRIQW